MPKVETVSSSEVDQFTRCETMHYFGYGMLLSPMKLSDPLQIGLCFHEGAAKFYESMKQFRSGELVDIYDCLDLALLQMELSLADSRYYAENVDIAMRCLERYVDDIDTLEWEVVAVEDYLQYQISDNVSLNGVIDLAVRIKRAPEEYKHLVGKIVLVDHKTCYNFFTRAELRMHSQLPKYVFAANRTMRYGEKVHGAIINQIRWRHDARDKVRRSWLTVKDDIPFVKQKNLVGEHLKVANRIVARRSLPIWEWEGEATRTQIKDVCKNCEFVDPCDMKLSGVSPNIIDAEIRSYFGRKDLSYRETRDKS